MCARRAIALLVLLALVTTAQGGVISPAPHGPRFDSDNDARFGWSVAALGDINGDGLGDLAVGEPLAGAGRVEIFLGNPDGFPPTQAPPSIILTGVTAGDQFGLRIAGVGDVDGDSLGDLLVGAPYASGAGGLARAGRAYLYLGADLLFPDPAPALTLVSSVQDARFGSGVGGGADVTGEGLGDLLVSAPVEAQSSGAVYLFDGALRGTKIASTSKLLRVQGDAPGDEMGQSALAILPQGILVGSPKAGSDDRGAVDVLSPLDGSSIHHWDGEAPLDNLGFAVSTILLQDELLIVAGAPGSANEAGEVLVLRPGEGEPVGRLVATSGGRAGSALDAGDFDGDGDDDLAIGAPTLQNGTFSPGGIYYLPGPIPLGTSDLAEASARILGIVNSGRLGFDVALVVAPDPGHGAGIIVGAPRIDPQAHLLLNSPPETAFLAPVVECAGPATNVTLQSTTTDPDGADLRRWAWTRAGVVVGTGPSVTTSFPPGDTPVTLSVTDAFLATDAVTEHVQVIDTSGPIVHFKRAQRAALYYEDAELLPGLRLPLFTFATHVGAITLQVEATDACSPIERVEFWTDGELKHVDRAAPWEWKRDPHAVPPGFERLRARAYDTQGNAAEACLAMLDTAFVDVHHLPVVGGGPPPVNEWRLERIGRADILNADPGCEGELILLNEPIPVDLTGL